MTIASSAAPLYAAARAQRPHAGASVAESPWHANGDAVYGSSQLACVTGADGTCTLTVLHGCARVRSAGLSSVHAGTCRRALRQLTCRLQGRRRALSSNPTLTIFPARCQHRRWHGRRPRASPWGRTCDQPERELHCIRWQQ